MKISTFGRDAEPSSVGFTEETLFKVYRALRKCDLNEEQAMACVNEMQNEGILFRERVPAWIDPDLHCPYCPGRYTGNSFDDAADALDTHILEKHALESVVSWSNRPGYRIRNSKPKALRMQCPYCDHRAFGPGDMYGKVRDDLCKHIFDTHGEESHKPVTLLCAYCDRTAWGENFSEANRVLNSHINANHGEGR